MAIAVEKTVTVAATETENIGGRCTGACSIAIGGSGSASCTIKVQGSLDNVTWVDLATVSTTDWSSYAVETYGIKPATAVGAGSTSPNAYGTYQFLRANIVNAVGQSDWTGTVVVYSTAL